MKMLAQVRHQLAQFVMAEERRRAAAKVQLLDGLPAVEVTAEQANFLLQGLQVRLGAAAIFGDDFIARTVIANVRAERHVHIQR
ncbi:hypothetical protein D3C80_1028070 [compost metagenome]